MSLVDRAKNIIMSPKTEWEVVASETPDIGGILTGYVLPMAALPALASFIGWGFISSFGGVTWGIAYALISLFSTILGVFLTAFVVQLLAPSFGSEKDLGKSFQLVAYAYTPSWVGGILGIIPALSWLGGLFGLYGIYLMYLGFPVVLKTPKDKVIVYMIITVIVLIILYMVLLSIITGIIFSILGLSFLSMM